MGGLIEIGEVVLNSTEKRLELVSRNITNASTPGFKKETVTFPDIGSVETESAMPGHAQVDFSAGTLNVTGRSLDLAISGDGFFAIRAGDNTFFTRSGSFERSADGSVLTPQGGRLQGADFQDLVLDSEAVEILEDGVVLDNGRPIARVGLFLPPPGQPLTALTGSLFQAPSLASSSEATGALVRQGMLEGSNVELGSEMVSLMAALREAEAGSRIVQVYDALIGQSLSTFGKGGQ